MNILIITYICIVLLQVVFIKYYIDGWQGKITGVSQDLLKYNLEHQNELDKYIYNIVKHRIQLLDTMDYNDWLVYNNKNAVVTHGGNEYYLSVYEHIHNNVENYLDSDEFVMRVNATQDSLGMTYADLIKQDNYAFLFSTFTPNPSLIRNMFDMTHNEDGINTMSYYWLDPITNRATKKKAVTGIWSKEIDKDNKYQGVIMMGYGVKDIEIDYSSKYYEYMHKPFMAIVSISTLISSIILYLSTGKKDIVKPLILLITTNMYLTTFFNTTEGVTTLPVEQEKVKDINDGILSISFLVAVNIFIIETLKKVKTRYSLHNESAFLFCLALILLLFSLYKKTNYTKINDMREHRIEKQLMFNMSIFINLFILFNYLIFVGGEGKLFKFSK